VDVRLSDAAIALTMSLYLSVFTRLNMQTDKQINSRRTHRQQAECSHDMPSAIKMQSPHGSRAHIQSIVGYGY